MSSGLTIVIAVSTAAAVIVLSLMISTLVHTVLDDTTEGAPDLSGLRGVLTRRYGKARRTHLPPQRSVDMNELGRADFDESGRAEDDSATYRGVGDRVAAVLTAAEQVAAQIRADADSYSEEARAAADAYAEETRRRADEDSARTVSQAEEQASLIRSQAEQKASEIETEAVRRRHALATTNQDMQERIASMLAAFRRAESELEELLPDEERSGAEERVRVDDALSPASPRGAVASRADR